MTILEIREKYEHISKQFARLHKIYSRLTPYGQDERVYRVSQIFKRLQERHDRLTDECAHPDFIAAETGPGICPDCGYYD